MTLISRDPFARTELHRESVPAPGQTCSWCGGRRPKKSGLMNWLFQYETQSDGGRKSVHRGLFCSVGCFRDYHAF